MMSKESNLMDGTFGQLLTRSNKQLREDRGLKIVKTTRKLYRRRIEDLEGECEDIQTDRENLMDVNPGNTHTIINPSDFDSEEFITADIALGVRMRQTRIKLELATESYENLFGNYSSQETDTNDLD